MRIYVISSILLIIGLVAIAFKGTLQQGHWALPYVNDLSSVLLVGGLLSMLFKVFQDGESETNLRRLLRIHDSVDELGLVEIMPEVQAYNFTDIIQSSDHLSIVMNDGLRWVGNNAVTLKERFSKKGETNFFLVDPDSSFIKTLSEKTSTTEDDLKHKIYEAWSRIENAWNRSAKKGTVFIYRIKTFPTKSMFLTENELVETPYQTASGRASIPVFIYKKVARLDSPYNFAITDIEEMKKESSLEKELKS